MFTQEPLMCSREHIMVMSDLIWCNILRCYSDEILMSCLTVQLLVVLFGMTTPRQTFWVWPAELIILVRHIAHGVPCYQHCMLVASNDTVVCTILLCHMRCSTSAGTPHSSNSAISTLALIRAVLASGAAWRSARISGYTATSAMFMLRYYHTVCTNGTYWLVVLVILPVAVWPYAVTVAMLRTLHSNVVVD